MTDNNTVLENLRANRGDISDIKERLGRMETRLSSIEHTVGYIYATAGDERLATQSLAQYVERAGLVGR